jgi:hypothetical protein
MLRLILAVEKPLSDRKTQIVDKILSMYVRKRIALLESTNRAEFNASRQRKVQ